jgi:tetratricopeptide (TPR) repeat protein
LLCVEDKLIEKEDVVEKKTLTPEPKEEVKEFKEEPVKKEEETNNKKKRKRKRKRKKKKKKVDSEEEYLKELAKKEEEIIKKFWTEHPNKDIYQYEDRHERYEDILKIEPKNLNYIKEMQKLFNDQQFSKSNQVNPGWSKKQMNMHREYMKKFKPKKKYFMVYNEDVKFKLNDKLSMKEVRNDLGHKCKFFVFHATGKIASLAETYKQVKNTMDIGSTMDFLQTNPYYPEALYDLGEYQRLQGNFKEANLMLEKMLFFYEDSLEFAFRIFESNIEVTQLKGKFPICN